MGAQCSWKKFPDWRTSIFHITDGDRHTVLILMVIGIIIYKRCPASLRQQTRTKPGKESEPLASAAWMTFIPPRKLSGSIRCMRLLSMGQMVLQLTPSQDRMGHITWIWVNLRGYFPRYLVTDLLPSFTLGGTSCCILFCDRVVFFLYKPNNSDMRCRPWRY